MATDFAALLDTRADTAERPKPLPSGSYRVAVSKYQTVESRDNKTPGIEFEFRITEAGEDVDPDTLGEIDLQKKSLRHTFWLTDEAMYRLTEFFERLGFDTSKSFAEMLPEAEGQELFAVVSQNPSRSDSTVIYNNIDKFLPLG